MVASSGGCAGFPRAAAPRTCLATLLLVRVATIQPFMRHKILIVDDDPDFRRLARLVLQSQCSLREAGGGEEALVVAAWWRPDLVLLDVAMQGLDGYETCRRLKAAGAAALAAGYLCIRQG